MARKVARVAWQGNKIMRGGATGGCRIRGWTQDAIFSAPSTQQSLRSAALFAAREESPDDLASAVAAAVLFAVAVVSGRCV